MNFRAEFSWRKDETSTAMIDFAKDELTMRLINEIRNIHKDINDKKVYDLIKANAVFTLYETYSPVSNYENDMSIIVSVDKDNRNSMRVEFDYDFS